jgi:hypothetical protein
VAHRFELLAQIIRLLLTMIPQKRAQTLKEDSLNYETTNPFPKQNNVPF